MILRLLNSATQDRIELRIKPGVENIVMPFFSSLVYPMDVVQIVSDVEHMLFSVVVSIQSFEDIAVSADNGHLLLYIKGVLVGGAQIQDIYIDTVEIVVNEGAYLIDELLISPGAVSTEEIRSWHVLDAPFREDAMEEQQVELDGSFFGLPPGKSLLILEGDDTRSEGEMVVRYQEVHQ